MNLFLKRFIFSIIFTLAFYFTDFEKTDDSTYDYFVDLSYLKVS